MNLILSAAIVLMAAAQADTFALAQRLSSELLGSKSATATLETWCRDYRLAPDPKILAVRVANTEKPATAEQRLRLNVPVAEPVRYRRVLLRCGTQVLSEADLWYVPARLTPEMNRVLDTTDTPFGRAVASLEFYRRTLTETMLWKPGETVIPPALFEHRAVLYSRDHTPIAEVVEVYQRAILGR